MSKQETIQRLTDARAKLLAFARELPAAKRDEIFLGAWSVKDLLAHLVGWDYADGWGKNRVR